MAEGKCTKIRRVVVTENFVDLDQIVLTLSRDEAETLRMICYRTSGSPEGRRGDMAAIDRALTAAGVADGNQLPNDIAPMMGIYGGPVSGYIGFNTTRTKPVPPYREPICKIDLGVLR
jgi:hypothetical protein